MIEKINKLDAEGKRTGFWREYYNHKRIIGAETNYIKGLLTGLCKYYYQTGELEMKGFYLNDKNIGLWKDYRPDGTLKKERLYIV